MPLEIALQAVDFIANNLFKHKYDLKDIPESVHSQILFFGGEPLLQFDEIIKPVIEYCNIKYPQHFMFKLITNGTLLTEKISKFLADNNTYITISFDGIKEVQDYNRPCHNNKISSYDLIINNLPTAIKYNPALAARATVNEFSVNKMFETYILFEQLGFMNCSFYLEYFQDLTMDEHFNNILKQQIHKIYEYRKKQYQENIKPIYMSIDDYLTQTILQKKLDILTNLNNNNKSYYISNFCGYGLHELNVNYCGDLYPCKEECTAQSSYNTIIGNIKDGINFNKLIQLKQNINEIENNFLNNAICNNDCLFKKYKLKCQYMPCPAHSLRYQKIYVSQCKYLEYFLQELIQAMKELIQENNQLFLSYLDMFKEYQLMKTFCIGANKDLNNFILQEFR